ncbi:MAG TPA: hypothetical protein DHV62_03315, partial [Elusimicrobia bacterium]|nr:hypothetical protein [Elusimicrobiota bacterium]
MLNTSSDIIPITNQEEIIAENRHLKEELKQRIFELSILYELSNAISYTLDYDELIHLLVDSLHRVVNYDFCASLLIAGKDEKPQISIRTTFNPEQSFLEEIRNNLIIKFNTLALRNINLEQKDWELKTKVAGNLIVKEQKVKSSFDVPLFVRDEIVGILNIGSIREIEYPEETIKLLYTIASQASGAIERLQAVISAEKSKMRIMVENMSEGVIMTDEKDELIIHNPTAREMLGFNKNEK